MTDHLLYTDIKVDVYLANKEDAAKIIQDIRNKEPDHPVLPELERIYNEK